MAFDAYLKLGDIEGDSTNDKHKNEIVLVGFNWSVGRVKRKLDVQDFTVFKSVDKASPQILTASCDNTFFPQATVTVVSVGANPIPLYEIDLQNVFVVGVDLDGSTSGESGTPMETVKLSFTDLNVSYRTDSGVVVGSCSK